MLNLNLATLTSHSKFQIT